MTHFANAGVFLVSTVFYLYTLVVLLRFLLQLMRADFYNPVSQFAVKATSPVLVPMRRVIPGFRGVDVAALVLLLALKLVELGLIAWLSGISIGPGALVLLGLAELINLAANFFLVTILIQVVISWVNPGAHNPVISLLYQLNEPLLGRARRVLPPISGLDLSPIVVLIGLQLVKILLVAPLESMARGPMLLG